MRLLLPPLLLAFVFASGAYGQQIFSDPDFGFTMKLPDGLHELTEAERSLIPGVSAADARNVPRAEAAPGQRIAHRYFWVDRGSPYNRQMDVHLFDESPPYRKPEELIEAFTRTGLSVVDTPEQMRAPVGGLRIEGTFMSQGNVPMRKTVLYLPDIVGGRYGIVSMQCFGGDWAIVKPEFLESLLTVRLERAEPPAGAVPGAGRSKGGAGGRPPGGPASAKTAPPAAPADWKTLPVAGSLVLSALMLGHLLLGGRSAR